jgi:predicted ATPase
MILDSDSPYYQKVRYTECFNKSLLRGTDIGDYALIFGKEKLRENSRQYELRSKGFTVKYDDCNDEIALEFSPIKIKDEKGIFPNGIISFIGKNGSGKSTFLYKLATELFASANNRKIKIIPEDIVVSQLMLFSYSPFDDFILPIQCNKQSLKKWYFDLQKFKETKNDAFKPRFIYCGIRDVKQEVEELINAAENSSFDENGNYKENNRLNKTSLVNTTRMSDECKAAFQAARQGFDKDWNTFITNLIEAIPELTTTIKTLDDSAPWISQKTTWDETFKKLSTGHKFFLHTISHLIAYCEENAVIMFDEPENHLQAPLLSFMMKEIRRILAKRSSVMLVATHSPVILQETLSSNVRVVRRSDDTVTIQKPEIETYGASFGAISSYVFDLSTDKVSYFDVLKSLFEHERCKDKDSVKDAVDAISNCLGSISDIAIRYIVQLYLESRGNNHVAST